MASRERSGRSAVVTPSHEQMINLAPMIGHGVRALARFSKLVGQGFPLSPGFQWSGDRVTLVGPILEPVRREPLAGQSSRWRQRDPGPRDLRSGARIGGLAPGLRGCLVARPSR